MKNHVNLSITILLIGAGTLAYEIYDFQTVDIPRMEQETTRLETAVGNKQNDLRKLQEFAQNIEKIKQDLRQLNLQLESALEHMPRTFNLSELLRKLTMLAQNSGIELATFKPRKAEEKQQGSFYSTIKIDFDLRGTFSQTLVFLDQLSRLKRIVNVDSLRMRIADGSPQHAGSMVCSTQATINTFRFTE